MGKKKREREAAEAAASLEHQSGPAPAGTQPDASRLTPLDIQQKIFREAFRGYNERDVDAFLDRVTEELAHALADNRRLREQVEVLEMRATAPVQASGAAEADALVRAAREEAGRILAEAREGAATARSGPADEDQAGALLPPKHFIHREREFLQGLASLIQRHAEAVREDLRAARGGADDGSSDVEDAAEPAVPEPSSPEPSEAEDHLGAEGAALLAMEDEPTPEPPMAEPSGEAPTQPDVDLTEDEPTPPPEPEWEPQPTGAMDVTELTAEPPAAEGTPSPPEEPSPAVVSDETDPNDRRSFEGVRWESETLAPAWWDEGAAPPEHASEAPEAPADVAIEPEQEPASVPEPEPDERGPGSERDEPGDDAERERVAQRAGLPHGDQSEQDKDSLRELFWGEE